MKNHTLCRVFKVTKKASQVDHYHKLQKKQIDMLGKRHAQQINRRHFWKTKGQITKTIGNF